MQENKGSITSLVTAFARAYHSLNASNKMFDDYLARCMFSDDHWAYMERNMAGSYDFFNPGALQVNRHAGAISKDETLDAKAALSWVMRVMMAPTTLSRSRYTEDNLEKAIAKGIRQYVILGAGMDTFAFRRPDLLSEIQVFELDHPATQAQKLNRISELGWEIHPNLHFVPIDFSKDSIAEALEQSSYNPAELSYFSWLGVVYYLTNDVVLDVLRSVASITLPGSLIVFDYPENDSFDPDKTSEKMRLSREIVKNAGEPMKGGFDPAKLSGYLEESGWLLLENLSPTEIEDLYFKGRDDGYHATDQTYFAMAEVVGGNR
jgi:methyltransferase (TIGR00027 family)